MNTYLNKKKFKDLIFFIGASTLLCFMAFYNLFPLIFNNDSRIYIESAFKGEIPPERPILYSFFIMYTSFKYSLWLVVIMQSMIVTLTIYYYFRFFTSKDYFYPFFLGFVILITFFMGGSFNVSWLMADVFAPISILCAGLLLFIEKLECKHLIIISLILILSIAMHNSHFYILIILLFILLFGFVFKNIRKIYKLSHLNISKVIWVIFLVIISNIFLSMVHYKVEGKFKGSRGGVIFFMGNLVEMGVIDVYLAENCKQKNYELCQYKDMLPNNYIWAFNSPLQKTGWWEGSKAEYTAIIKDILTTPKYLKTVVFKSMIMTLKQFFHFDTGEALLPWPQINKVIMQYYPNDYPNFINSKQSTNRLSFDFINHVQKLIVGVCLLIYMLVFTFKKMTIRYRLFIAFILLALLANAAICGIFSGVFPRYQSRLVWLLPLPLFLYGLEYYNFQTILLKIKKTIQRL